MFVCHQKKNLHWFSSLQPEYEVNHKCWQEVEEWLADLVDETIGPESEARIPHDILCRCITSMLLCQNAKVSPTYRIHWSRSAVIYTDCIWSEQKKSYRNETIQVCAAYEIMVVNI
jgi:hypothetical protein